MLQLLLVNPFASARYLSNRFKEYGVTTVALYTIDLSTVLSYMLPPDGLFDLQVKIISDNLEDIIKALGNNKFDYVINCFEASVELSDRLATYYTPQYANDPATSFLRSNKYEMHKRLAIKGLSHIHQVLYDTHDKLPNKITFPCFVKPLAAAASIGASKINNEIELENYFKVSTQYKNFWQNDNNKDKFLISEYVGAQAEILVDTFSLNGQHYISTIQMYNKEQFKSKPFCCYSDIIRDKALENLVINYINNVLEATEYNNGFAHTELFLLPNNELKLIEINARTSGGAGSINRIALLSNHVDHVALLMKHIFNQQTICSSDTNLYYRRLYLFNLSGKPLHNLENNLKKYATVFEITQVVPDGHILASLDNIDLSSAAAFVILSSTTLKEIENDTKQILTQDKIGWN